MFQTIPRYVRIIDNTDMLVSSCFRNVAYGPSAILTGKYYCFFFLNINDNFVSK